MPLNRSALDFASTARTLASEARRRGLVAPGFRSPPRLGGVHRSLRRYRAGGAMVAVQIKGRPWGAVVGDMIEGVIATNRLKPPVADKLRTELWQAVGFEGPLLRVA